MPRARQDVNARPPRSVCCCGYSWCLLRCSRNLQKFKCSPTLVDIMCRNKIPMSGPNTTNASTATSTQVLAWHVRSRVRPGHDRYAYVGGEHGEVGSAAAIGMLGTPDVGDFECTRGLRM